MTTASYRPIANLQPTPAELAEWVGGELREGEGAPARLTGMATLAEAGPGEISFAAGVKVMAEAARSQAGVLIVPARHDIPGRPRIVVAEVWAAVATVLERLYTPARPEAGIHPSAVIAATAKVRPSAHIGPCCVIGERAEIGAGAVLGPHCIVGDGCRVGAQTRLVARVTLVGAVSVGAGCLIHPGAVLGSDGFKFEVVDGRPMKIPQVGTVVIHDGVEIGANTTIDRAFLHETRVGRGTKIDNLVQIGHNVTIGEGSILAGRVGVAGSTKIGNGCMIGASAGLSDNVSIGDGAMLGANSGIYRDVEPGEVVLGSPIMPIKEFWRVFALSRKLPELVRRLKVLEEKSGMTPPPKDEDSK